MYEYQGQPIRIRDGDSSFWDIDCGFDIWRHNLDIRLKGIDCPELGRPDGLGEKARAFVLDWLEKHPGPYIVNTTKLKGVGGDEADKFGRMLADVQAPDKAQLIADLLAAELARPYDGHGPKPW